MATTERNAVNKRSTKRSTSAAPLPLPYRFSFSWSLRSFSSVAALFLS